MWRPRRGASTPALSKQRASQRLILLRRGPWGGLLERKISAARVRRALAAILEQLPPGRPLSGVRIYADGRDVAVYDGAASWHAETGQALLDFEVDSLARAVDDLKSQPRERPSDCDEAGLAFERALELEDEDPKAAANAYARALKLDPELVDAYVNMGRIAHEQGDPREAVRLYHFALERTPDDPVVHFNLALALEDTTGSDPAIAHYERALTLDPDFADAHFNLAGLCEEAGRGADALRHYHAYKKLTEG